MWGSLSIKKHTDRALASALRKMLDRQLLAALRHRENGHRWPQWPRTGPTDRGAERRVLDLLAAGRARRIALRTRAIRNMLVRGILVTNCLHERKSTRSVFNKLPILPSSHYATRINGVDGSFPRNRLGGSQNYVERKIGNMLSHDNDPRRRIRCGQLLGYR